MPDTTPDTYTPQQAQELLDRYPYFTMPALLALKRADTPADDLSRRLAARVAVELPDMDSLAQMLGPQATLFDNFYPDEHCETPDTNDTIDTFLATFGKADERETDALTKLIFSPTPDYGATLAAEEREHVPTQADLNDPSLSEQDRLITGFIARTHAPTKSDIQTNNAPAEKVEPQKEDDTAKQPKQPTLTESLVRVLVKNGNYAKAIEIISELNLKNPEKSIYFADQIRFLRKLIINANKK